MVDSNATRIIKEIHETKEELRDIIRKFSEELHLHIESSKVYRNKVDMHDRQINGVNGKDSLMNRVDDLEKEVNAQKKKLAKFEKNVSWVIVIILTVVLTALVRGLIPIIAENLG